MRRLLSAGFAVAALPLALGGQTPTLSDSAIASILTSEMQRLMERLDVPGGVLIAIRGKNVLVHSAFGIADREKDVMVSVDSTVFRVASVAKVVTAVAALQLERAGRLSLSEDVRRFVPDVPLGPEPLTMIQLLTHTAGFDERLIGYASRNTADSVDLSKVLAEQMPSRSRGTSPLPGYSNDGYALAGLVIERVAGIPFNRYARERIFEPLGMMSTAFMVPPLPPIAQRLAAEYRSSGERRDFIFSPSYPAGNIGTTGSDMRRFLEMLLGHDSTFLSSSARARLLGPAHVYHPEMPAMGLGLAGQRIAGHTMWIKGGAAASHSAVVAAIPELDFALFVAVNRQEPLVWERLLRALGDSLRSHGGLTASATSSASPVDADGVYRWTRTPLRSAVKVAGLAAQMTLERDGDSLRVTGPELEGTWVRRGTLLYERADGRELALHVGGSGSVDHVVSIVQGQPVSFERVPFYETARFQLRAGVLAVVLGAAAAVGAARQRRYLADWESASIIGLPLMHVALTATVVGLAQQGDQLYFGPTKLLYGAAMLATTMAAVGLAQSVAAILASARSQVGPGYRIMFGASSLAGIATLGLLGSNNLIGFRF